MFDHFSPISLPYSPHLYQLPLVASLLKKKGSILLDSGLDELKKPIKRGLFLNNTRYDIFCAYPCVTIENTHVVIHSQSLRDIKTIQTSALNKMRDILIQVKKRSLLSDQKAKKNEKQSELPFNGGWMGYLSYNFGQKLLSKKTPQHISEIPDCAFGLYRWALISDHDKKTTHLYAFGLSIAQWKRITSLFLTYMKNCKPKKEKSPFCLQKKFQQDISFSCYKQKFEIIQKYIREGHCYQVNYAQRFKAPFVGNSFLAYSYLTQVNNSPFSAFLNHGKIQFLSVSPERFIQIRKNKLLTQPIKGTAPRYNDHEKDKASLKKLQSSEKDKAENLMIVDLLRNDISKTAKRSSVEVPELFGAYSFKSVHHLISTITSQLDSSYDAFDVLATCLPGGSITGAPKLSAVHIIEELENFSRGIYCGIIGYIDFEGNMDTNISIRTLIAHNDELTCYAGGGIVSDSLVHLEYEEIFHKLSKIIPVLEKWGIK
jgi:para-aminobenzoate synthetase component 1